MASISSIEKDSIATTRDSFKDCILACKINNKMHTNFKKRKIPKAAKDTFVQKRLFCKTISCAMFVSLSVAKILEKHVRSSLYLA